MTQETKVLEYLKTHDGLTQRQALYLGVYRLSAVIFNLKKRGYRIHTEDVKVQNVDGTFSWIGNYHLISDGGVEQEV